jgi:CDP-glycerol glycerophosphotransferase (TagB/SpsB family)
VSRFEYLIASAILRILRLVVTRSPIRTDRVVLASARGARLEGNFAHLVGAIAAARPDLEIVLLLEPYGYGVLAKLRYLLRLVRGMYLLQTTALFIVDNAYLPVHVAPHRPGTTVVQVWHAAGALKRFGLDTVHPVDEPERTFLHRYYDYVVNSAEADRGAWASALRTPIERVLPLGTPRTDFFHDPAAVAATRERVMTRHPELRGRVVVTYAPTFRGRGRHKRPAVGLDGAALRLALSAEHALVIKTHPNLDASGASTAGFDLVIDPGSEMNELLAATDILITDYSSAIFEWALLGRPLIVLSGDLDDYEADPGLYLDYRAGMIGTQVSDTAGAIDAIMAGRFDLSDYGPFIARHMSACDGHAAARFVDRFLPKAAHDT